MLNHKVINYQNILPSAYSYYISELSKKSKDIVFILDNFEEAEKIYQQLKFFISNKQVLSLREWDNAPYDPISPNITIQSSRIKTLYELSKTNENGKIIVTTPINLIQKLPPKNLVESSARLIKKGDKINYNEFLEILQNLGYTRVSVAYDIGEFAVRGGVIDIMVPSNNNLGIRLDFFGDLLEKIKIYEPLSQTSKEEITCFNILPTAEIFFNQKSRDNFCRNYIGNFSVNATNDLIYESIKSGRRYPGMENFLPFFYDNLDNIFNYLSKDSLFVFALQNRELIFSQMEEIENTYEMRKRDPLNSFKLTSPNKLFLSKEELENSLDENKLVYFSQFEDQKSEDFIKLKNAPNFFNTSKREQKPAFLLLKEYSKTHTCIIGVKTEGAKNRIENILTNYEINFKEINNIHEIKDLSPEQIGIAICALDHGFVTDKYTIFSSYDLIGEKIDRREKSAKKAKDFLSDISSLEEGEIIVHKEYGIGKFLGLETLEVNKARRDFLKILYDKDDKLYVPVENIDLISKFGSNENIILDRLGSAAWQARKAILKKKIKDIASKLLKLAAMRKLAKAEVFVPNKTDYDEFCSYFSFVETDDQLSAIDDIQQDLASGIPMDRLICGDVGFGKTEVALRAAFMALVKSVNQIAVIVPTTLLCRQHFKTFNDRFSKIGVKVESLSRLKSSKEATIIKKELENGNIDIIVGTHALLSKDIKFKNLSMMIIDEEQHFGVSQKERLKELKAECHVLTLSATPIPRTLQMSMTGLKDLSLIATPPVDRIAVKTFIMPLDIVTIREAIMREYYRGGKIFYVTPRIADLDALADMLRTTVPEVKFSIAHGQMSPQKLDEIMNDFYDRKFDLLLSTTIVESGLDIENANTIIINNADKLGLAQLYQLRGRVGRGKIKAYAYLTYKPRKALTQNALRRLEVMHGLDTLGAGFSLASHDMDIRGFGNLIGDEQSGHIKEVGIELYQEMLNEAILNIQQQQTDKQDISHLDEKFSPEINIGISVMIPEAYVSDVNLRLSLYKRMTNLSSERELEEFAIEMIDRFGPMPIETNHLLEIVKIKNLCIKHNINKIDAGPKAILFSFRNDYYAHPEKLLFLTKSNPSTMKIRPDQKFVLMIETKEDNKRLKVIYDFLSDL